MRLLPQAGGAGADAAVGRDREQLRDDHAGAGGGRVEVSPFGGLGELALVGVVLADDRDRHPVGDRHLPLPQGGEQRRPGNEGRGGAGEEAVHGGDEAGVALGELQVADAAGAGEQVEGELHRVEPVVAAHVLEPGGAGAGRLLEALHQRLALQLVVSHGGQPLAGVALQRARERDGVLHRQLGAGADGEVGGVGGVAEQHDVAVVPARAADGHEAGPQRPVGEQLVAGQLGGEQLLAEGDALLLAGVLQAGAAPGRLGALDDEGGGVRVERVGVDLEHAMLGGAEHEGEGVQHQVGAEPHVPGAVHVEGGPELPGEQPPGGGVDTVGGHHQVTARERVQAGHVGVEGELDAEVAAAALQDLQQPLAGDRGEHVAAGADGAAAVDDVDGAPAGEGVADLHEAGMVGVAQRPEGLLGEHHPPAEGRVGCVALDHGDLVRRVGPLGEQREVQPGGPSPKDADAHRRPSRQASTSASRSSWAGSDTVGSSTRWSQPASW